jgi:glucans biosynthesis protein
MAVAHQASAAIIADLVGVPAPVCAETRIFVRSPCSQAAVTGRARCRMHGGAKGSGGPKGDRNRNFKEGIWTRESVDLRNADHLAFLIPKRYDRKLERDACSILSDPGAATI